MQSAEELADTLPQLGDQLGADVAAFALDALGQDQVDGVEVRPDEVEVLAVVLPRAVAGESAQRMADLGDERKAERSALALEVMADPEQRLDVRRAPSRIVDRRG